MKKVLIFTYYFPPAGGVAVQRFLKFSKFLPEYGWQPIVVTVKNGSYPYMDEKSLEEVPASVKVYRTKTFEPFELYNLMRGKKGKSLPVVSVGAKKEKSFFQSISEYIRANFFIPDARKGWVPYAIKQAEEILSTEKIDAIITTGPPNSTHLIGLALKKKYGVKWIADFRDPWTGIFYNEILPRTKSTQQKDKAMETEVLQTADCVTVISPGMKKEFEDRAKKIEVVYNGYDEGDFALPGTRPRTTGSAENKFTIRYVGNLMSSQNVEAFWTALAEFKKQADFIIEFTGRVDNEVKDSIAKAGLTPNVIYNGFVEHKAATQLMQQANMLLLVIPQVRDNALIMTGKIYEYIGSLTEIIAIGPPQGDAAEVLRATGRKPLLDYVEQAEMLTQLQTAYNDWKQNRVSYKYAGNLHLNFSRKNQTRVLAGLLEE